MEVTWQHIGSVSKDHHVEWHFIQTENDYDKGVFNGDVGIVERQQVAVRFDDRLVKLRFRRIGRDFAGLRGHHPQVAGSEFTAVVIPLATQHYMLLQRNLIYKGITRGKQLLVLIGQKKALGSRSATTDRSGCTRGCC